MPSPVDVELIQEVDSNDNLATLVMKPKFFNPTEVKPYMYVETVDKFGHVIDKYMLKISGSTGKTNKTGIQDPIAVEPAYYSEEEETEDDVAEDGDE